MATRTLSAAYNAGEAGIKAAIEAKASTSALAAKANTSDVEAALALKANTTDVTSALAGKADTSHSHTFDSITSKPTTLSGYGITDTVKAVILTETEYSELGSKDSNTIYFVKPDPE